MALSKSIILNTPKRTVIKYVVTGETGSHTNTDVIALTDIVSPGQTVSGTPLVSILGLHTSAETATNITVIRNTVPVLSLFGTNEAQYVKDLSFSISEEAQANLELSFTHNGTFIIELRKEDGYTFGAELATIGV